MERSQSSDGRSKVGVLRDQFVGAKLRHVRNQCGIELWQLAHSMNVSVNLLMDYEAGRRRIEPSMLAQVARMLGTAPRVFFEGYLDNRA